MENKKFTMFFNAQEETKSVGTVSNLPNTTNKKYSSQKCKQLQSTSTMTLTYGDVAENHRGMEKIGNLAKQGFSVADLEAAKKKFEAKGYTCELIDLNKALEGTEVTGESAAILIARGGINYLHDGLTADKLFEEQMNLDWDTKAKMYGRVVEKHARSNLCYAEYSQEPDYENGKGRIVAFKDIPMTEAVRNHLDDFLGPKGNKLMAEGNLYYDISKCGIGFHGDTERRIVVALRLGARMNIQYQWFIQGEPVGKRLELFLNHGDLYVMSEKASGYDWKTKRFATLRHAAGAKKFTTIKAKKAKSEKKGKKENYDKSSSEGEVSEDENIVDTPKILDSSKKISKVKY